MSQQEIPAESLALPSGQTKSHSEGAMVPDTRTPLFRAYNEGRYQRQELIKQIQDRTQRRLICYVAGSNLQCMIQPDDTLPFVDLLHNVREGESLELLLHTIGGSVDAAEKLMRLVRSSEVDPVSWTESRLS